jgi:hypothetical protein
MKNKACFYRRMAVLMKVFWTAVLADALYIFSYIRSYLADPSSALEQGNTLTAVPAMTEHILMAMVMLLLCACATESLRRHF